MIRNIKNDNYITSQQRHFSLSAIFSVQCEVLAEIPLSDSLPSRKYMHRYILLLLIANFIFGPFVSRFISAQGGVLAEIR